MYEVEKSKVQISEVTYMWYISLSHWERHHGLEIDFTGVWGGGWCGRAELGWGLRDWELRPDFFIVCTSVCVTFPHPPTCICDLYQKLKKNPKYVHINTSVKAEFCSHPEARG